MRDEDGSRAGLFLRHETHQPPRLVRGRDVPLQEGGGRFRSTHSRVLEDLVQDLLR